MGGTSDGDRVNRRISTLIRGGEDVDLNDF